MKFDVQLSENFRLYNLVRSAVAVKHDIHEQFNVPFFIVNNLYYMAEYFLEPLQKKAGRIVITSGYRHKKVNKLVGGSVNSLHMKGQAVDFAPESHMFGDEIMDVIWNVLIHMIVDQAIRYDTFFHVSYRFGDNRNEYLDFRKGKP